MMNKLFFPSKDFNLLFFIFWILSVIVLFSTNRGDVELFMNRHSFPLLDKPVYYLTFLGHGTFAVIILIIMLFKNYYYSFYLFFTLLLVTIFSNLFKRFFFLDYLRPMWNFYYDDYSRVLYDAPVNYLRSFPSGHAMTAFALVAILALIIDKRNSTLWLFFLAILVSISRVYLLQHYFSDIVWGAIFGYLAATLGYHITELLFRKKKEKYFKASLITDLRHLVSK